MDKRILDVVSTKYLTRKISIEIELEKLLNSNLESSVEIVSEDIMNKVKELKDIASQMQTWESILSQLQQAEDGDNKQ
jgi:diacylglycerol kinase